MPEPQLHIVMYHYVRDLPRTRFPRLKGMLVDQFCRQVDELRSMFEMASMESAFAFLRGEYLPRRDLCLLTFDDGLKEHFTHVLPILREHMIQGLFGIITACVQDHWVAPVHMNHFLTAQLKFDDYRDALRQATSETAPGLWESIEVDPREAEQSYPLDTRDMAIFKLLVNFLLPAEVRDAAIRSVFGRFVGAEPEFARELYLSWAEVRAMQSEGMVIAGHSHRHRPLAGLSPQELEADVSASRSLLDSNALSQPLWPFSYPYGKRNSFSVPVVNRLEQAGYHCGLTTELGGNRTNTPLFELRRTDCVAAPSRREDVLAAHA